MKIVAILLASLIALVFLDVCLRIFLTQPDGNGIVLAQAVPVKTSAHQDSSAASGQAPAPTSATKSANAGGTGPTPTPVVIPADAGQQMAGLKDDTDHSDRVRERVDQLMALAMNNDSASLNTIWSELCNPDKEIRAGALEAVIQFGDRGVTPALRDLAKQTPDPEERKRILDAVDFLELPTMTELQNSQTNRPAASP